MQKCTENAFVVALAQNRGIKMSLVVSEGGKNRSNHISDTWRAMMEKFGRNNRPK